MGISAIRKVEELGEGTKLVARYKGKDYRAEVVKLEDGTFKIRHQRKDYSSPSAAGKAITGGAVNGWKFWSLEGTEAEKPEAKATAPKRLHKRAPKAEAVVGAAEAASDPIAEPFEEVA